MKKRSLALFLALVIGILYYGYCSSHFFGGTLETAQGGEATEFFASAVASAMVTPHIAIGWIAVVLNLVAFLANSRGCALAAVILYAVSAVVFMMYALFVIPEVVFAIIGYVRLKSINRKNKEREAAKAQKQLNAEK